MGAFSPVTNLMIGGAVLGTLIGGPVGALVGIVVGGVLSLFMEKE